MILGSTDMHGRMYCMYLILESADLASNWQVCTDVVWMAGTLGQKF